MAEPESSKLSIRSKALKLIQEGKSDLEVAIQLNLSANEVLEYRREFLILKNEDDLLSIYPEIKDKIPNLLALHRQLEFEEISTDDAIYALTVYRSFKQMMFEYECLLKLLTPLRQEAEALVKKKRKLKEEIKALEDAHILTPSHSDRPAYGLQEESDPSETPLPWLEWEGRQHQSRTDETDTEEGIISLDKLFPDFNDDED